MTVEGQQNVDLIVDDAFEVLVSTVVAKTGLPRAQPQFHVFVALHGDPPLLGRIVQRR